MSDEKKIKIELPDALEEPAKALSMPLATNIGTTIGDLWFLALGGISQKAALKRAKYANALEKYKADLEKKLNEIPEERRIEPNTQVVLNALTASQSCVEEEALREMFANLIASASDSEKVDAVHPAFPEIIKQMSTVDAELLMILGQENKLPIVNICAKLEKGNLPAAENVFIEHTDRYSLKTQSAAVACLSMLGLIEASYRLHFVKNEKYEPFKSVPLYVSIEQTNTFEIKPGVHIQVKGVELEKGQIGLTAFGRRFLTACT